MGALQGPRPLALRYPGPAAGERQLGKAVLRVFKATPQKLHWNEVHTRKTTSDHGPRWPQRRISTGGCNLHTHVMSITKINSHCTTHDDGPSSVTYIRT